MDRQTESSMVGSKKGKGMSLLITLSVREVSGLKPAAKLSAAHAGIREGVGAGCVATKASFDVDSLPR